MEITLDALYKGKPTLIKDKEYKDTRFYVEPFIDKMRKYTDNFIVKVQMPDQVTVSNDTKDITYNKVWIQALMPERNGYTEILNFVYSLDVRIPVYKLYRTYMAKNAYIFDESDCFIKEFKPEISLEYPIEELLSKSSKTLKVIEGLNKQFIEDKQQFLGMVIDKLLICEYKNIGGKVKLSSSDVIKAYEDVYQNLESPYNVKDQESTIFNFLDAICNQITLNKDIVNRCEKTILANLLITVNE